MKACLLIFFALLTSCSSLDYESPTSGPTANLVIEADVKLGGFLTTSSLDISVYQFSSDNDLDYLKAKLLGWKKIDLKKKSAEIVLPTGKPLRLQATYRSYDGANLSGARVYVLFPEEGSKYIMQFWTDRKRFSTRLLEELSNGKLVKPKAYIDETFAK